MENPKLNIVSPSAEMNETEIRENIVAPFLAQLGYRWGTAAHLGCERQLRYTKAFLGHKKENDPPLRGKADYICDVISHGRFVVEVKGPNERLDVDVSHQAYTYAAHPEVGAWFYLLTNGHEWRLYRIGQADEPVMSWRFLDLENRFLEIKNVIGPDAIRRLSVRTSIPAGKPLADGLGANADILGGHVYYAETKCSDPQLQELLGMVNGIRVPIMGGEVTRQDDMLQAVVQQSMAYEGGNQLNKMLGIDTLIYNSAAEYISNDPEHPTIFQNLIDFRANEGLQIPSMWGQPAKKLEMDMNVKAITQATGYYASGRFKGTFAVDYYYTFIKKPILPVHLSRLINLSKEIEMKSVGDFEVILKE